MADRLIDVLESATGFGPFTTQDEAGAWAALYANWLSHNPSASVGGERTFGKEVGALIYQVGDEFFISPFVVGGPTWISEGAFNRLWDIVKGLGGVVRGDAHSHGAVLGPSGQRWDLAGLPTGGPNYIRNNYIRDKLIQDNWFSRLGSPTRGGATNDIAGSVEFALRSGSPGRYKSYLGGPYNVGGVPSFTPFGAALPGAADEAYGKGLFKQPPEGSPSRSRGDRPDDPGERSSTDSGGGHDAAGTTPASGGGGGPPERSSDAKPFLSNPRTTTEGGGKVTVTTWDGADGKTYQQKSWENADGTVTKSNIEKVEGEAKKDESAKEEESTKSEEKEDDEDINANQNTTYENPQEDGGDEGPYKRVFIPTAADRLLLIAAVHAAQEVNRRTPKPGTDTGWQPFGNGTVARAPERSSGSYIPDGAAGQMMMASAYEGSGGSRFRSPATDGPDQVPLGAARPRERAKRGVLAHFRPNPDDPNPSPGPKARSRQG